MNLLFRCLLVLGASLFIQPAFAQAENESEPEIVQELRKLSWQEGPGEGKIADKASIKIPAGYVFLGEADTARFLELNGNPPQRDHYLIAPEKLNWFAVFSFDATGYVKDDEKIDPDALLEQLKKSDAPGNKERKRLGMAPIYTDGWEVSPHYDNQTKQLEWGLRIKSERGDYGVNYTSRLLGRSGVMSAVLVSSPEQLNADTKEFKSTLANFSYLPGERYAEYKAGDKVAEYGLAALVLGGAAAVATKKGFWGALGGILAASWKLIAGVAVAALAGLKGIFKRKE